jgi:hypothetical protein
MPEPMSQKTRQELLQRLRYDYRQSPKKSDRGKLIDLWCRASWNRSDRVVHTALKACQEAQPFALRGYDSDNGTEMINRCVNGWLASFDPPVEQTRSRPYRKNDNAHIEQKNFTHVRQLLGWDRIGHMELTEPLNDLSFLCRDKIDSCQMIADRCKRHVPGLSPFTSQWSTIIPLAIPFPVTLIGGLPVK